MVTKSTEIGHSYEMRWDKGKKTLGTRWMGRKVRREGKEGHPLFTSRAAGDADERGVRAVRNRLQVGGDC